MNVDGFSLLIMDGTFQQRKCFQGCPGLLQAVVARWRGGRCYQLPLHVVGQPQQCQCQPDTEAGQQLGTAQGLVQIWAPLQYNAAVSYTAVDLDHICSRFNEMELTTGQNCLLFHHIADEFQTILDNVFRSKT